MFISDVNDDKFDMNYILLQVYMHKKSSYTFFFDFTHHSKHPPQFTEKDTLLLHFCTFTYLIHYGNTSKLKSYTIILLYYTLPSILHLLAISLVQIFPCDEIMMIMAMI